MLQKTNVLNKALFIARCRSGLNNQSKYKKFFSRIFSYKCYFPTYERSCDTPKLAAPECCIDSGKYYDQLAYLKEPTSCKNCPLNSEPRLYRYFCESCPIGHEPMEGLYGCQRCPKSKHKKQVGPGKCASIN